MELGPKTKIDDLIKTYPFLMDFFLVQSPKFRLLQSEVMRKTVGRIATLNQVASVGGLEIAKLLSDIAAEIRAKTGKDVKIIADVAAPEVLKDAESRHEVLKDIIRDLHQGVDMSVLKKRFYELIKDVEYSEIAKMEQKLMEEGMPESEVKRLCDVHVQVFKESLEAKELPAVPAGHPVHTLMLENRAAEGLMNEITAILEKVCDPPVREIYKQQQGRLGVLLERLSEINLHYLRKENQLFPVLELHGITGPSEVMWAIHDDIRELLKKAKSEILGPPSSEVLKTISDMVKAVTDMIYKEEHILFPMCMDMLTGEDWARAEKGEEEIGYAWIKPEKGWKPEAAPGGETPAAAAGEIVLDTGHLSAEQINLLLTHLPVDISFVNEKDEVVYYSQTKERIFPRSPGVIGRKVQNCHPPKSFHMVHKILDEFRAGNRDTAEFWIQMKGRVLHIRYFAVRDNNRQYRGTLEVSQDITEIQKLTGNKRLLDWD